MIEKMPSFEADQQNDKTPFQEGGPITDAEIDDLFAEVTPEKGEFNMEELLDEETKNALGNLVENMVATEYKGEILVDVSDIKSLPEVLSAVENVLGKNSLNYFRLVLGLWKSEGIYRASPDKPWMIRLPGNGVSRDIPLSSVLTSLRREIIEPEVIRRRKAQVEV